MVFSLRSLYFWALSIATSLYVIARALPWAFPYPPDVAPATPPAQHPSPTRPDTPGYSRDEFGAGWGAIGPCTTREHIMVSTFGAESPCTCLSTSTVTDIYTDSPLSPDEVEIDHIIPLSAAWDLGADQWSSRKRQAFANDPLNLVAVHADINREKSDQLPSKWLPPSRRSRCWYAQRIQAIASTWDLALPRNELTVLSHQCPPWI